MDRDAERPDGTPARRPVVTLVPAADAPLAADSTQEAVKQPVYGVRAESPGPRGCWSLNKHGEPCGSARRAEGDYCNAHSGLGVAADPKGHSVVGRERSAANRRRRANLRLELGITRKHSPRGLLTAMVHLEAERVAAAALDGAIDPALSPASRAAHALRLIDAVDPQPKAVLDLPLPTDPEGVARLGLNELRALAEQVGIPSSA